MFATFISCNYCLISEMMDTTDQIILERLKINCRTSLQDFSRITGISANEVKKRIDSLVASGIIKRFKVVFSPLMTNEDTVIVILEFENEPHEKILLNNLSNNSSVHKVSRLLDGRYIVFGVYFEQEELSALTTHLRKLPSIRNIEMHFRFLHYWGGRINLSGAHREILRCLLVNPRMPVSDVARETGLESDNVKYLIEKMTASEAVLFTIDTSEDMEEKSTEVLAKVQWNVGKTSKEQVITWLQEQFGSLRLGECVSATDPTLFFHFSVKHVYEVELVAKKTREFGLVTTIEPMILFPGVSFTDPRQRRAQTLLEETGFSSQNGHFA